MSQRHLPPATDASSSASLTRRTLLAATAAAVPTGAALFGAAPALADPSVTDGETRIVDVPLAEVPLGEVDGAPTRELAEQPATMVGVTWPDDMDEPEVQARGLDLEGEWTPWLLLESTEDPETGEAVAGTEAGWIGAVSALQIRALLDGADVTERLVAHVVTTSPAPADAQVVALADAPVTDTAASGAEAAETEPRQMRMMSAARSVNPATPTLVGAPSFTSRAAWGANESWVRSTRAADELKSVVVHHTAGSNNYSRAESAQIVRGIQRYHAVTLGWADIGYNMLVSRYGQVFEGRGGGLHRNIIGAHALGFNTESFGISVMGDYSSSAPPRAAQVALSQLVGWKLLSTFHTRTDATVRWTSGGSDKYSAGRRITLPVMMGHRDVNYTACPGDSLYARFGAIRDDAQDFHNGGWKEHLWAFEGAGGASALGTVVRSAHRTGRFTATQLTKGLVLQEDGRAHGYATPFGKQWRAGWGRPEKAAFSLDGQTMQKFDHGGALRTGSSTVFHDGTFLDVPPDLMYRAEIEKLAGREITRGWPDHTYRPLAEIQRDAMVAFVYRALGKPAFDPPKTSPFSDMPPSRMFYKEITWARHRHITNGWPDGTFRPTAPVERGAVAAFLYRASGATSTKTSTRFSDVPRNHQFAKEITWLADAGITTGWPDGTFRPVAPIARDAMAAFMIRWMKHRGL
ncbi:hypothetical protein CFK38_07015 [Brachybacterium vulturis]|uniref:SLH domain-containing protein n=1 Tax=Brachybacterium vulturis TaxID=2017484 RepID=A0A291GMV7_9MICO|nr:S-layer homology domain-containing protein [Brachybacterium vulturis]ATG51304.1 hypothetical protein CFK38_07015 [Brachybacterium vulturis]